MSPFKSSLARTAGKLLRVQKESDLSLRGGTQRTKKKDFSATGGDATYTPGNGYKYHKFTTSGSLIISAPEPVNIDVLVVAGGGGGGAYYGAGGGAGGVAHAESMPISSGTYPVNIGSGGTPPPGPPNSYLGDPGSDSYFGTPGQGIGSQPDYILAKGGGGGGKGTSEGGLDGGSGGGSGGGDPGPVSDGAATQPGTNPSPFVTDYGNQGGFSTPTGGYAPAGGGGAGAAGGNINGDWDGAGNGGVGKAFPTFAYPLIGLSPLNPRSPSNSHYAGGGGGGIYNNVVEGRNGTGGHGGGGSGGGSPSPFPEDGVDKLGGGGGGRHPGSIDNGGDGGDGIVIVRYVI